MDAPPPQPEDSDGRQPDASPLRRVDSRELFGAGERRVLIRHDGRDYVLIRTKRGKLVLNLLG